MNPAMLCRLVRGCLHVAYGSLRHSPQDSLVSESNVHAVSLIIAQEGTRGTGSAVTQAPRQESQGSARGGQARDGMALDQTQSILQPAVKNVAIAQHFRVLRVDARFSFQPAQRLQGVAGTHRGKSATKDELQVLNCEFDVHQPAVAALRIEIVGRFLRDLQLHPSSKAIDLCGGVNWQRPFIHQRVNQVGEKLSRHGEIASQWPGLDQRLALPDLAAAMMVIPEGLLSDDQRALVSRGSKPGIHLVQVALAKVQLHEVEQALDQLREIFVVRNAAPTASGGFVRTRAAVDEEQVKVGMVAELATAQFSKGDHRQRLDFEASARLSISFQLLFLSKLQHFVQDRIR